MVLSPQDIHNKEFSVKMRGYSIDEVNDFLDEVLKDYQITIDKNHKFNDSLKNAEKKLKKYDHMKNSLNQSILVAQEAADKVKKQSQVKSNQIIKAAKDKAKLINQQANQEANSNIENSNNHIKGLAAEIEDLKKDAALFRNKYQAMLESQLQFVKNEEWNNLLNSNSSISDKHIHQAIQTLDNNNPYSVKSKSKSSINDTNINSTLVFYPDDSYKIIK